MSISSTRRLPAGLERAQLATPFHLHTGLWTVTLAAAICAMVATTALPAHTRRTRESQVPAPANRSPRSGRIPHHG